MKFVLFFLESIFIDFVLQNGSYCRFCLNCSPFFATLKIL
ncbi:hypothetical protein LEP1GSC008_2958 [Leptospira kirschneri serovar Bulgarica str. Nikolaevo]|uniref:Uncharacterized protein n=1 Tax=Leptospira kirschneri serovar Bulgarica str. Nikolaevo TaxID=1240687 RepID=M6FB89_9LEPT|nr:hypothetical protein LEP1GSC008_2958 [Leptospira kirschneri serovar Bulgarica str. Nikolaevo]